MIIEKKCKPIETIITKESPLDMTLLRKRSNAHTPVGIVIGYIQRLRKSGASKEYLFLLQSLYRDIKNLEISERVKFETWRGKSGVKFIIHPDKVIAIRHRKTDKEEQPKEVPTEITKDEINKVIWAINKLDKGEKIQTSEIAELTYGKDWKVIFSTRPQHIKLTEILNYLEYKNWIKYYRSGQTKVLDKLEIQEVLK